MADHSDPISAPRVDPDFVESANRAPHVRLRPIGAAGVVMIHGVLRDDWLNRGCRILRRLRHIQHRRVENDPTDSRPPLLGRDGNCGRRLLVTVTAAAAGPAVAGL